MESCTKLIVQYNMKILQKIPASTSSTYCTKHALVRLFWGIGTASLDRYNKKKYFGEPTLLILSNTKYFREVNAAYTSVSFVDRSCILGNIGGLTRCVT